MGRRSVMLRVAKWVGTGVCVLIGTTFAYTGYSFRCWRAQLPSNIGLLVSHGVVEVERWCPKRDNERIVVLLQTRVPPPQAGCVIWRLARPSWRPRITWSWPDFDVVVPLWIPFTVCTAATACSWHSDRRRTAAGHCRKCGYDLTGNVSGRCPECGTQVADQGAAA